MWRHPLSMAAFGVCLLASLPGVVQADPPGADCAASGTAANVSPVVPVCNPLLCDVMADPAGSIAPPFEAIRVGDAFGSPDPEWPRFFFDAGAGRFHTRLFSQIYNNGGENVPSGGVTVRFSVKPNATGPGDTSGSFDLIGDYILDIPPSVGPFSGLLTPSQIHRQQEPVCWLMSPGALFPKRFLLKIETIWPPDEIDNNRRYRFYDFGAQEPPADIAFALDLSGSMAATIPGEGTRLAVAQDRARMFVDVIEPGVGNRLGVYGFATEMPAPPRSDFTGTWKAPAAPGTETATLTETAVLFPFAEIVGPGTQSSARLAISDPARVRPYGCTPIGQGLLRAKRELELLEATPSGHRKAIVLFSDGLQNVGPFVREAPPWTCGSPTTLALIDAFETFRQSSPTLPIYTIFFGEQGDTIWNHQLMLRIQEQTGGSYLYHTANSLQLAAAYFQIRHLVASNALLYIEEKGQVAAPGPGPAASIHFDSVADTATVVVAWPVSASNTILTVEGRREGDGAWQDLARLSRSDDPDTPRGTTAAPGPTGAYRVYRFIPGPGTTWELRVRQIAPQAGTTDYALAVFAPSEEARMRASLGSEKFTAGQPLPVFADLRFVGHPIADADVKAVVTIPDRAASNVLRRYAGRLDAGPAITDTTVANLAAQLRQRVQREEGSDSIYSTRQITVPLRDDGGGADLRTGDGIYSGQVAATDTTVAGLYDVVVTATGKLPSGTAFERSEKLGAVAAVGPADRGRTEIRFSDPVELDDGTLSVGVTVLAVDRFGNATFPGAGGQIRVTPKQGGGAAIGGLADNLDSTYTQQVAVAPGQDVAVDVSVGGADLGSFSSGSQAAPGLEWSLHLGAAFPHGSFDRLVETGPSIALDGAWRLSRRFAVRGELGFNLFADRLDGDRLLVHLVPYLQVSRASSPWDPYFEAGLGLYDLENGGTAPGFAVGAGVHYDLASHWRLDLGVHSHHAGGGLDLSYSQLMVGILYTSHP